jgi:predicted RNA-binding protein YlxR (DUF448 family)
VRPKQALVRLVRGRDGVVVADARSAAEGRGAYVCPDDRCLARALHRSPLTHAFRKPCEASEELAAAVRISGFRGAGAPQSEASGENASEEVRGLWRQR